MRRSFIIAWVFLLAGLCCIQQSSAFWQSRDSNYNRAISNGSFQGVGDIVSGALGWVGLRAYSASFAASLGPIADIVDTTTGLATCTINVAANGSANLSAIVCPTGSPTVSVTTFCTVTHSGCSVTKLYDQTGNGAHLTEATLAAMPTLALNCLNTSLPCMTFTMASASQLAGTLGSGPSVPYSFSFVGNRTANFTSVSGGIGSSSANRGVQWGGVANEITTVGIPQVTLTGVADSAFHAMQAALISATSCAIYADGTSNTASSCNGASMTTGWAIGDLNGVKLSGNITEGGVWASGFSSTQAGNICHNQDTYWGISGTC